MVLCLDFPCGKILVSLFIILWFLLIHVEYATKGIHHVILNLEPVKASSM